MFSSFQFMFSAKMADSLMSEVPIRVSFLLVSGFMMAAFVLAADALRLANWREGRRLFLWISGRRMTSPPRPTME